MQMTRKWEFKQKGNAGIEKFNALCVGGTSTMDFFCNSSQFIMN